MLNDPDDLLKEEMRLHDLVSEAVGKADAVILANGLSEDDMLELTFLVGMEFLKKAGFQVFLKRERTRIEREMGAALQPRKGERKSKD